MPIYEYSCAACKYKFEILRNMSKADEGAACPKCNKDARRVLSLFASFTKNSDGSSAPVAGTGRSCSGCSSSNCGSCH